MKIKNICLCVLSVFALSSCFEDEGNYTYLPDIAPVFDFPDPNHMYCYAGDTTLFEGKFHFDTPDSLELMSDLSYEWKLNGKVLSTKKDFNLPTDSAMKILGLKMFPTTFMSGTYEVIHNKTGMRYLAKVLYNFVPAFGKGNWMILSENGANARLSYQRLEKKNRNGRIDSVYHNYMAIYKAKNNGEEIAGKPRLLMDHRSPDISSYCGATLVVTDQEAYEVNNESLVKAKDLKEEFASGAPAGFSVKDVFYSEQYTLLAMEDGKLYRRQLSENYLGGKFISTPYVVDQKGYEADFFANGQISTWVTLRLCYDRKNHRVLMVTQKNAPKAAVMPLIAVGTGHTVTPWQLDVDVEVIAISEIGSENSDYGGNGACYCMIYNQRGKTYIAHFFVNNIPPNLYGQVVNNAYMQLQESPVPLTKDNIIRMTSTGSNYCKGFEDYILYSSGNEIRYIQRSTLQDGCLVSLNDRVTAFRFAIATNNHEELGVGLANGDFVRVNVKNKEAAFVVEQSRFNVGGEIVDLSHTGGRIYNEE